MNLRVRLAQVAGARDPGHGRLTVAIAVSLGVLGSALLGLLLVHLFDAKPALLSMSVFLSVQAGNMVRDRTAPARLATTALLIPTIVLVIGVAALLAPNRPAAIAAFIALTGAAIWVRRFGPRASAAGAIGFMGYFFTLFMQPTLQELPGFAAIAASAIAAQLVARAVLMLERPRRRILALIRELQVASASAIRIAARSGHGETLRAALARIDDIGQAIVTWQRDFRTDQHIACTADVLESRALDARVDTEEACAEIARTARTLSTPEHDAVHEARTHFDAAIDAHAPPHASSAATTWARDTVHGGPGPADGDLAIYMIARATLAHAKLGEIDLSHGLDPARQDPSPRATGVPSHRHPGPHAAAAPSRTPSPRDASPPDASPRESRAVRVQNRGRKRGQGTLWKRWSQWHPSSRMAVQAMVAAGVASAVGEAISASRWYWAVMTAFVIFIGATTRGSILTRAFRRVAGTAGGIAVGLVAITLTGHHTPALIAISVVAVFGMLYFGPLNYIYSATFITIMLVAIYGLLGVLDQNLLELRLVETLSGALIGVLCAYLIMSSNSRPALIEKVTSYFDAMDALLQRAVNAFGQVPGAVTATGASAEILPALQRLEEAQTDVDASVSGMSTAFLVRGSRREVDAVHLMYVATRAAARVAQSSVTQLETSTAAGSPGSHPQVVAAFDDVRGSVAQALRSLTTRDNSAVVEPATAAPVATRVTEPTNGLGASSTHQVPDSHDQSADKPAIFNRLKGLPADPGSPDTAAVLALTRLDWAMRRVVETVESHRKPRQHHKQGRDDTQSDG